MQTHFWDNLTKVLKQEVVPALGCTEPVSVALATAIACEKLGSAPQSIHAFVSANLMKNGMGVGIPGTGMVGLPVAAALGALAGDASAGLEVLKNVTPDTVNAAKSLLAKGVVSVELADVNKILYTKVLVRDGSNSVSVTIADSHTHVIAVEENGITTFCAAQIPQESTADNSVPGKVKAADIYDYAMHVSLDEIAFIEQAKILNDELSQEGLRGHYGLQIGATLQRNVDKGLLSGGLLTEILTRTSSASDARMDGAMKPAMSNSGSGNQGIAATMPVVVTADFLKANQEQTLRALTLANLMAIYIKSHQHKLSALCGATTAAMGAAAGITYLLGGNFRQISYAISSMIGDIAGVICDGAKTSCAMKVSSSAGAAVKASLMAMDDICVTGNEGIVATDVESSIQNLSALANGSMMQTDTQILNIMLAKSA